MRYGSNRPERDLKAWREEELRLLEDPNNLSDAEWRARELLYATDCDPHGHSEVKVTPDDGYSDGGEPYTDEELFLILGGRE